MLVLLTVGSTYTPLLIQGDRDVHHLGVSNTAFTLCTRVAMSYVSPFLSEGPDGCLLEGPFNFVS